MHTHHSHHYESTLNVRNKLFLGKYDGFHKIIKGQSLINYSLRVWLLLSLNINFKSPDVTTIPVPDKFGMTEFGEVLEAIGNFGRFQKWLVLLLCIPNFLTPFHMFGQVFITMPTPHFCNTSWIRAINPNLSIGLQWNLTIPRNPDGSFQECSMYTPVDEDLETIIKYGLNDTEKCQDGWLYPEEQKPTLLTEVRFLFSRFFW